MLYVLCGIPASGKTTLSKQLSSQYNAKLYCYDEFIKLYKKHDRHEYLYNLIANDLAVGHNIVLDDLHTRFEWRKTLLDAIKDIPCKKILIIMTTPLEECIRRNAQRQGSSRLPEFIIYHLNKEYQPPSLDEGWDEILYY